MNRRERIGILMLVFLICVLAILPSFLPVILPVQTTTDDTAWFAATREEGYKKAKQASNPVEYGYKKSKYTKESHEEASGELFAFDPNTLDRAGWQRLGLSEKIIETIMHYREKGGRFRYREDMKKLYGLSEEMYDRLMPYIVIADIQPISSSGKPVTVPGKKERIPIDINLADTTAWIALPGVGSKLAARIVKFREKLGGFYTVNQVGETFGLADSVFQKIKSLLALHEAIVKKININTASVDELKSHPYIGFVMAKAIVAYRTEHGAFKTIDDLRNVGALSKDVLEKLKAYLEL